MPYEAVALTRLGQHEKSAVVADDLYVGLGRQVRVLAFHLAQTGETMRQGDWRVPGEERRVNALQQEPYLRFGVASNKCFAGADEVAALKQPGGLLRGEYQQLLATACYQLAKQRLGIAFIQRGQCRIVVGVAGRRFRVCVRVEYAEAPGGNKFNVEQRRLYLIAGLPAHVLMINPCVQIHVSR